MGGQGGGIACTRGRVPPARRRGPRRQPDRPGAGGGVGDRLGRVRARGDARPQRQRGDRLLDRERRPDGRAHRRLASPWRRSRRSPTASTRSCATRRIAVIRAVGVETGGSNIQFAVNPQTDEIVVIEMNPRVSRSLGARVQGHGLPDRQDRRAPGGGLRARGDRQRHHEGNARQLRADDRLRGGEVAALRLREVPRRRRHALHPHAVGRRGDGDRAHVQAGVREGDALARARRGVRLPDDTEELLARLETPSHDRFELLFEAVRRGVSEAEIERRTRIDPWFVAEIAAARARARIPRPASSAASSRSTPARPSSRPRRPTTTRAGSARPTAPRHEVRRGDRPSGGDPRRRARTASGRASSSTTAACTPR